MATPAGQSLALAGIHGYQHTLAPVLGRARLRCRFTPTCSRYAEAVIARDGLIAGGWKSCAAPRALRTVDADGQQG